MQHGLCDDGVAGLGASCGQNTENPEVVTEQHTAMNRTLNSTYSMKPDLSRSVSRMSVSMSSVSPNSWRCHMHVNTHPGNVRSAAAQAGSKKREQ